jgi:hypothetical protein
MIMAFGLAIARFRNEPAFDGCTKRITTDDQTDLLHRQSSTRRSDANVVFHRVAREDRKISSR